MPWTEQDMLKYLEILKNRKRSLIQKAALSETQLPDTNSYSYLCFGSCLSCSSCTLKEPVKQLGCCWIPKRHLKDRRRKESPAHLQRVRGQKHVSFNHQSAKTTSVTSNVSLNVQLGPVSKHNVSTRGNSKSVICHSSSDSDHFQYTTSILDSWMFYKTSVVFRNNLRRNVLKSARQ